LVDDQESSLLDSTSFRCICWGERCLDRLAKGYQRSWIIWRSNDALLSDAELRWRHSRAAAIGDVAAAAIALELRASGREALVEP